MIDVNRLCPGCMRELDAPLKPGEACPHCGFLPAGYQQNARCLSVDTILAGKYLVGAVLGEGGFGITYMGFDLNMEARIAIKEYFPVELVSRDTTSMTGDRVLSLSGDKSITYKQGLEKYVAEARNVSQFSGTAGVVSVKDFFYENETAYIVMEYIEGKSLKDYLRERGGRLSEEEALAVMKPVLEALEKVHASGIIHRDISPDNIMLSFDPAGNIASVKLIDFGAARMTAKSDQKSLTIILKHGYAPEEQYRTHGEQGPWTDVYAVCAVFYKMLTGETPTPAMDRLFSDGLKTFEDQGARVSRGTSHAVLKGLAVKKEDRIQSVRELSAALYEGKAVKAVSSKKRLPAMGIAAACVLALAVGTALLLPRLGGQEQEPPASSAPEQSAVSAPEVLPGTSSIQTVQFEEEQIGEQIVWPDPQTSVSYNNDSARYILFCLPDGSAKALGANEYGQCAVQDWSHIVAVSAGEKHSLGLRSDGRVFAVGNNAQGQCNVETWQNIVDIAASYMNSYGLTADGHVVGCGYYTDVISEVSQWENIVAITADGSERIFGLDADGRIHYASNDETQLKQKEQWGSITDWQDVKHIVGVWATDTLLGLREDGSVIAKVFDSDTWYSDTLDDITAQAGMQQICVSTSIFGVRADGTLAYGDGLSSHQEAFAAVGNWTDLIAAYCEGDAYSGSVNLYGLKRDGTVLQYIWRQDDTPIDEMKNLAWAQLTTRSELAACTREGEILSNGRENSYIRNIRYVLEEKAIPTTRVAKIVGVDGVLLDDGSLWHCEYDSMTFICENEAQVLEVWDNGFIALYAWVDKSGCLHTKFMADEEQLRERYPSNWDNMVVPFLEADGWENVVQIAASNRCLYVLHNDGSIKRVWRGVEQFESSGDIVRFAATSQEIVGIRSDGTAEIIYADDYAVASGRTQLDGWKDLVDIALGESHTVGLRSDGTVVAAGSNHMGQCDVEDWTDIVSIDAAGNCTIGVTSSGELKMAGSLY